ncbi:MAG: hypothetical protein ACYTEQ_12915 [Planctomycetota bacterium]|jgi:hypothetical protein
MNTNEDSALLLFPDPLWTPDMVSGAAFLYFDRPMLIPIPSASSLGMLGAGPIKVVEMVKKLSPPWEREFVSMWSLHAGGTQASCATRELLQPLHGHCFIYIQLAYPHTTDWMQESEELLQSTGLSTEDFTRMIHPLSAADSLAKHVLFEMYISTVHSGEDPFALGQEWAQRATSGDPIPVEYDADPTPLYEYCDEFFSSAPLEALLVKAFGLRLLLLQKMKSLDGIFLSCPAIIDLLSRLPVEQESNASVSVDDDVVAWELFRQLVSPVIDPLNEKRVTFIAKCRDERTDEIARLRNKCISLVNTMRSLPSPANLEQRISKFIATEVEDELSALLKLDSRSFQDFMQSLFSDEKTWMALAALVGSIFTGHDIITAGSAVAALSNVGAKAFKSAAKRRTTLRTSAYTLLYNLQRISPESGAE